MIDKTIEILQKFNERYYKKYHTDKGIFDVIKVSFNDIVSNKLCVSLVNTTDDYLFYVFLDEETDKLTILDERFDDILLYTGYADERGWSLADVDWIRFGKIKHIKHLPDRFKFKSNINPFDETYIAQKTDKGFTVTWNGGAAMSVYSVEEMWERIMCNDFEIVF